MSVEEERRQRINTIARIAATLAANDQFRMSEARAAIYAVQARELYTAVERLEETPK